MNPTAKSIEFPFVVRQGHIFQDRHGWAGAKGSILIHPSDPAVSHIFLHSGDIFPIHQNPARIHRDTPTENIQHGRFAGSIAAYDRDELAFPDGQVEILKQAHLIYRARIIIFCNSS